MSHQQHGSDIALSDCPLSITTYHYLSATSAPSQSSTGGRTPRLHQQSLVDRLKSTMFQDQLSDWTKHPNL